MFALVSWDATVVQHGDYVGRHVQLGYAVTVHTAQGLTVDVTRGVLTGVETKQQLYVMATRGRRANHLYVSVVGDGDEHSLVHPTTLRPETALNVLQTILARDGAARSATTESRNQNSAPIQLTHAAAETTVDAGIITALDRKADRVVEGLTSCAAWPSLRATLLLNAVDGRDPLTELHTAVAARELEAAHDPAAVLTWRIHTPHVVGPLPWLPPIPANLTEHPSWGPYLKARAELVEACAADMREERGRLSRPGWALPEQQLTPELIEDVELWRAGTGVESADRRVLGPTQLGVAAHTWQLHLEKRLQPGTLLTWVDMLVHLHPAIHDDPFAVSLTHRMAALHAAGVPVSSMVAAAAADGPLPAEHPNAAIWWRLSRHLNPAEKILTVPDTAVDAPRTGVVPPGDLGGIHDAHPADTQPGPAPVSAKMAVLRGLRRRTQPWHGRFRWGRPTQLMTRPNIREPCNSGQK